VAGRIVAAQLAIFRRPPFVGPLSLARFLQGVAVDLET